MSERGNFNESYRVARTGDGDLPPVRLSIGRNAFQFQDYLSAADARTLAAELLAVADQIEQPPAAAEGTR